MSSLFLNVIFEPYTSQPRARACVSVCVCMLTSVIAAASRIITFREVETCHSVRC